MAGSSIIFKLSALQTLSSAPDRCRASIASLDCKGQQSNHALSATGERYSSCPNVLLLFKANQNLATMVALHQFEIRPSGFVTKSVRPPKPPFISPVRTKHCSLESLVS